MLNCSKCNFKISRKMKHAVRSNICPSCGHALLGEFHKIRMKEITSKLNSLEFVSVSVKKESLDDFLFDMSLFIMNEYFPSKVAPGAGDDVIETGEVDIREQVLQDMENELKGKLPYDISVDNNFEDDELEEELSDEEFEEKFYSAPPKPSKKDGKDDILSRLQTSKARMTGEKISSKSGTIVRRVG